MENPHPLQFGVLLWPAGAGQKRTLVSTRMKREGNRTDPPGMPRKPWPGKGRKLRTADRDSGGIVGAQGEVVGHVGEVPVQVGELVATCTGLSEIFMPPGWNSTTAHESLSCRIM